MDIIETLFAEHETLKREQKHRRLDHHGNDKTFYSMATEIAVANRLNDIRAAVKQEFKNQKRTKK